MCIWHAEGLRALEWSEPRSPPISVVRTQGNSLELT